MRVDLSCPIEIYDYELPTYEQPYCSLIFLNLDSKVVSSIQVSLMLLDAEGKYIARRMERVMGLSAYSKEIFDANVAVDDVGRLHEIDLVIEKVWFDDATVWRKSNAPYQEYTPNQLPAGSALEHLRFVAGKDAVGFPDEQETLWLCVCGRPNEQTEAVCRRCEREKAQVFAQLNPVAVQAVIEERERTLQEQAKRVREETVREEHLRKQEEQNARKRSRRRVIALSASLALAASSYVFVEYGLPEIRYRYAEAMLKGDNPQSAKEAFASLGDYKQALLRMKDADFGIAMQRINSGSPAEHEEGLRLLDTMLDYPAAPLQAQKTRYQDAMAALDQGEYERAETLLRQVGIYSDSAEKLNETIYQIAVMLADKGELAEAAQRFYAIAEYHDAAHRAKDCVYRQAAKAETEKEYQHASALYATIPEYLDAGARAQRCAYQHAGALKDNAQYEEAKAQFERLGDYEDAAEQALDCVYVPAGARMLAGAYKEAAALYATIPAYKDAAGLAKECVYLPAQALLNQGEYEQAVALFASIPGYQDADALLKKSNYMQAKKLLANGDLTLATLMFEAMGDYEDAKTLALSARYETAALEQDIKNYAKARTLFLALGDYRDAAKRANACQYTQATELLMAGEYAAAREQFTALGTYSDAKAQANLCTYKRAEELLAVEQYEEAAALFASLGKYEDAASQANACRYAQAEAYEATGAYEKAGKAFDVLGKYSDAKARSEKVYDTWLAELQTNVAAAMKAENYVQALKMIEDNHATGTLPSKYDGLEGQYRAANLAYAKQLIASGNSLPAYPYLQRVSGMKEAKKLLSSFIYMVLGTWESAEGNRIIFRQDGTCSVDGVEQHFNIEGYALMIGDTPRPQKRTHSIVLLDEKKLTLKQVEGGSATRYTRTVHLE